MFLVSVLALAGIGISYAGFSDSISVYGTVDTATVEIDEIFWFSGTWVWKVYYETEPDGVLPLGNPVVYDPLNDEIMIYRGFVNDYPGDAAIMAWATTYDIYAEKVASAVAKDGTTLMPDGTAYDVDMVYDNLFPCIDFCADFIFHYGGSIPAKVDVAEIFPIPDLTDEYPGSGVDFLTWLWDYNDANPGYGAWVEAYRVTPTYDANDEINGWTIGDPVDVGVQLHFCDYIIVKLCIHLPQDNLLQGLSGVFGGKIGVIQWNDMCVID